MLSLACVTFLVYKLPLLPDARIFGAAMGALPRGDNAWFIRFSYTSTEMHGIGLMYECLVECYIDCFLRAFCSAKFCST